MSVCQEWAELSPLSFRLYLTVFGFPPAANTLLGRNLFGIVMGRLNDRVGPCGVMILRGLLAALGYRLMSPVQTVWQLYLFYP